MNTLRIGGLLCLLSLALPLWAAVPPAPLELDAAQNDDVGVPTLRLTWIDPGPEEERFKVERKLGAGGTYAEIASLGANATVFRDGSVTANGVYYYRVRGWNAASGFGPYSNEAAVAFDSAAGDGNDIGWVMDFSYDPLGNLIQTRAGTTITNIAYDIRGRKTSMSEPNMGTWTYAYDVLNQLVRQTDAKAQVTTFAYDKLGRMKTRSEPDLVSTWTYDSCTRGVGKLCQVSSDNGFSRTHAYDSLGRPSQIAENIGGTSFPVSYGYDASSRLVQTTYPTGFIVRNVYNSFGHLQKITNSAGTIAFWQANTVSPSGRILNESFANGLAASRVYDGLDRITSNVVSGSAGALQNFSYSYDAGGNVAQRVDAVQSVTENYSYDKMSRLDVISGPGLATKTFSYARNGNLLSRSDVGTYAYDATKHHAVTSVSGAVNATYTYDANGNMTSGNGRTVGYTSYNMPATISGNGVTYTYTHNADHQRARLVHSTLGTFIYVHPAGGGRLLYERHTRPTGLTEHKHYLTVGNKLVGVHITRSDATTETRYLHGDSLGSVTLVTNASGAQLERLSYEAFGKRRFPNGNPDPNNSINPATTDRGFTGHEHLDEIGLIHMNGRVYDPVLGRFMTPDPFVQSARNLFAYNRYAYAYNNPLANADLSGFGGLDDFFEDLEEDFERAWEDITDDLDRAIERYVEPVIEYALDHPLEFMATVAAAYLTGYAYFEGWGYGIFGAASPGVAGGAAAFGNAVASGFAGGYVGSGGDLKAAMQGGFAGAVSFGLGSILPAGPGAMDGFSRVMLKGATSGLLADMQGGSFTAGFSLGIFTAGSAEAYRWTTSHERPDPLPGRNEEINPQRGTPRPQGVNVSGFSDPGSWCSQGSTCSRLLNAIPLFNSGALFHDSIFDYRNVIPWDPVVANLATMPPAALITIGAHMDGPLTVQASRTWR